MLVLGTIAGTLMVRPDFAAALVGMLSIRPHPGGSARLGSRRGPRPVAAERRHHLRLRRRLGDDLHRLRQLRRRRIAGDFAASPEIDAIRRRAAAGSPRDYLPNDPVQARRLRGLLLPLRCDAGMGAFVLWIVSSSFMIAGAAVLLPRLGQRRTCAMSSTAGACSPTRATSGRASIPALVWVYYVCVVAALWGTVQSYPEIYTRVTHDFCRAIWPERTVLAAPISTASIAAYVFAVATPLVWINVSFATLTAIVAFLATGAGVALAMIAALYLDRQLPPLYRTRRWMFAAGVLSAVILTAASCVSGWGLLQQMLAT